MTFFNPDFNSLEFEGIKTVVGLNNFRLSAKEQMESFRILRNKSRNASIEMSGMNPSDYIKKMKKRDIELAKGWGQIVPTPLA
ncbi:MAG: hypothetical protein IJ394_06425 [Bacteroidales bacterium]|nr:hypothetical protein [Bacteroidales bacterium]